MPTTRFQVLDRISSRTRKCLERLYKASPSEVIEDIVLYNHVQIPSKAYGDASFIQAKRKRLFIILDHLAPNAQVVVSTACELLRARLPPPDTKHRIAVINPDLYVIPSCRKSQRLMCYTLISTYTALFDFLESYIDCLEGPAAVQVWPPSVAFAKDMLNQATSHRFAMLPTLR